MNRQLIIRGAAVSVSAIAASVFLAGQFLGEQDSFAGGAITDAPAEIRGASMVGSSGPSATPAEPGFAQEFSALDISDDTVAAPTAQEGFQPELTFADTTVPRETSLCDATMTAAPAIDGLIELRLSAPCNADERVVISHEDLAFTATLDAAGVLATYIPALSQMAVVDAFLADDTQVQAQTQVSDFDQYARMIVQWGGPDAVALHAYHRGAQHGDTGHIHALNPFDPELEDAFLVSLGDATAREPMLAQVYSVPAAQAGDTRLQLELQATDTTCGTDMVAHIMPTHGPNAGLSRQLDVAMPTCASGDGLVILDLPFQGTAPQPEPADVQLSLDRSSSPDAPVLAIEGLSPES